MAGICSFFRRLAGSTAVLSSASAIRSISRVFSFGSISTPEHKLLPENDQGQVKEKLHTGRFVLIRQVIEADFGEDINSLLLEK